MRQHVAHSRCNCIVGLVVAPSYLAPSAFVPPGLKKIQYRPTFATMWVSTTKAKNLWLLPRLKILNLRASLDPNATHVATCTESKDRNGLTHSGSSP